MGCTNSSFFGTTSGINPSSYRHGLDHGFSTTNKVNKENLYQMQFDYKMQIYELKQSSLNKHYPVQLFHLFSLYPTEIFLVIILSETLFFASFIFYNF